MILLRANSNSRCVASLKPAVSRQAADWLVAFRMPGEGMRGDAMPAIALGSARGWAALGNETIAAAELIFVCQDATSAASRTIV